MDNTLPSNHKILPMHMGVERSIMYLTRVELDSRKRETQIALESYSQFHGAVEEAFEPRQKRNLWRIDRLNGSYYLLLLSEIEPNMDNFIRQFCKPETKAETKEYGKLLDRIENGQCWHFRLVANPSYRASMGRKDKIKAHVTELKQKEWLIEKSKNCGFSVSNDTFLVVEQSRKQFRKNKEEKNRVSMLLATFEGVMTVTDADVFRNTLCQGIGREKAFGAGMLTICGH